MSFAESLKHKWQVRIKDVANNQCKKLAVSIELHGRRNIEKALPLTSNTEPYYSTISNKDTSSKEIVYELDFIGSQLAFLEFGTGLWNEPYMAKVGGYVPEIATSLPPRASYGLGKGRNHWWIFYQSESGNIGINDSYFIDYRDKTIHHYYGNKALIKGGYDEYKPKIITKGIAPQRMIYNAIQEALSEVGKRK